jgi:hypothetical protein
MRQLYLLLAVAVGVFGTAQAGEWMIEMADSGNDVGKYSSLALDTLGYPHISYYYTTLSADALKYARWDGATWHIEFVDGGTTEYVGQYTSLALDSSGYPNISYFDMARRDLKYARWDGGSWQIEIVDSAGDVGFYTSLALDSSDYPHISYWQDYQRVLKYARWDGSSWQIETVDSEGNVGKYDSLALDSSDYPHISYYDVTNTDLKYARWDGSSWQIETVDSAGDVGLYTSLALDSSDYPHISYYGSGKLKYTRWDGSSWQIETVNSEGWAGEHTSLALDDSDYPHISFYDMGGKDLKYACWDGSSWHIVTVDTEGDEGKYTSLKLDDSGNPYISYYNREPMWCLKYAYWEGGPGVEDAELSANTCDEGVLVGWRIEGEEPAGVRVLRGDVEPVVISGNLPGGASRYLDRDVEPGESYVYWLEATTADGVVSRFGPTEAVTVSGETPELVLYAAYPNPSREVINFVFSLPADGRVALSVYDLSGRRIASLVNAELTAGRHEATWNCAEIPSGVYLYRLETGAGALTQRLVVSR